MSKTKFFYPVFFVASVCLALTIFYCLNETIFAETSLKASAKPCWFKGYNDPSVAYNEIEARQNREMYGYSIEVPIAKAVNKFNEEMRCYPFYDEFSELTEDEVIASLIDFDSHNEKPNYSEERREERKRIINDKVLPKGSLLKHDSGSCLDVGKYMRNDLCAKGLRITLTLNLDKLPDAKMTPPSEDVFVIRKTFTKFQPRQ